MGEMMGSPSVFFPEDYAAARQRFRDAAAAIGCELRTYPIDAKGPGGEELAIDVAISPGTVPGSALVVSTGLHGVEGFFGSAVQLSLLRQWARHRDSLPAVRCVLLHGLNPFGYAWRRRVNETNVDLNRNMLRDGEEYRGSPERYAALDALLNPARPPCRWEPVTAKLLLSVARYGVAALKEAVASGQYDYPKGLFYGGERAARTTDILAAHFDGWLDSARRVAHLDFHTGLGPWATYKLLVDHPLSGAQRERLCRWFGPDSFEAADGRGVAYPVRGSFGAWCVSRSRGRDYTFAAAEFGTAGAIQVLKGLRAENQAHHWSRDGSTSREKTKRALVELFCPRSEQWRIRVLEQSHRIAGQAIRGLLGEAGH